MTRFILGLFLGLLGMAWVMCCVLLVLRAGFDPKPTSILGVVGVIMIACGFTIADHAAGKMK